MFFRVLLITLLLGSAFAIDLEGDLIRRELAGLIVATYVVTIIYALVLRRMTGGYRRFAYLQLLVDMALTAVVVTLTGGTDSVFVFMYSLAVLTASFLLFRRGAIYAAAIATGLIVFEVARESSGWGMPQGAATDAELRGIILNGISNVSAVFFVALLAGYLSEQLRDTGQRLRFASQDLAALRVLNEHIINSVQSGLVSYTLNRRIIFFNPAAERITGRDKTSILFSEIASSSPNSTLRFLMVETTGLRPPMPTQMGANGP